MALHWIILLAAILPFWLLQNTLHELAHALALRIGWGWKFRIWPFPSKTLGRFTFAHVVYEPTASSSTPTNSGWALVSIMPIAMDIVFMLAGAVSSVLLHRVSMAASALCALFATCNAVDMSVNACSIFRNGPVENDIWQFQSHSGVEVSRLRWAVAALVAGAVGFVAPAAVFLFL